jgi:fructose-bisphosphate aldolase, class I
VSYPLGPNLEKAGETALDICGYATQMAAPVGANTIKVKPANRGDLEATKSV